MPPQTLWGLDLSQVHYLLPSLQMLASNDLLFCLQNMPRLASHPSLQYFGFVAHFLKGILNVFLSRAKANSSVFWIQVLHALAPRVPATSPEGIPLFPETPLDFHATPPPP